jgi:hypothetical protein
MAHRTVNGKPRSDLDRNGMIKVSNPVKPLDSATPNIRTGSRVPTNIDYSALPFGAPPKKRK